MLDKMEYGRRFVAIYKMKSGTYGDWRNEKCAVLQSFEMLSDYRERMGKIMGSEVGKRSDKSDGSLFTLTI